MEEKLFQMLVEENEISWKAIIYDLIKKENMDPWNVDVSLLAHKYIERLKKYKEMDLKIGGTVLLASTLLLKIKSKRLVGEDLNEFDRLLASGDVDEDQFYDELEQELRKGELIGMDEKYEIIPRTPQPRKRKVSVYDLVKALEQALEVKKRRVFNQMREHPDITIPEAKFDITKAVKGLFDKIKFFFFKNKENKLTFSQLVPSEKKQDKVFTFIPLLHLDNQQKIHLDQKEHFKDIDISLKKAEQQ